MTRHFSKDTTFPTRHFYLREALSSCYLCSFHPLFLTQLPGSPKSEDITLQFRIFHWLLISITVKITVLLFLVSQGLQDLPVPLSYLLTSPSPSPRTLTFLRTAPAALTSWLFLAHTCHIAALEHLLPHLPFSVIFSDMNTPYFHQVFA